jgi:sugar lactone lactonase YvrE
VQRRLARFFAVWLAVCAGGAWTWAASPRRGAAAERAVGQLARRARLTYPAGVAFDPSGALYIADTGANRIYKLDRRGRLAVVAGTGRRAFGGDDGPAERAEIASPQDLAFDRQGNLYFTDSYNHRVRRVGTDGVITTVAGTGKAGYSGDGGPATRAGLSNPQGVAVDRDGDVLVADTFNHVVRKVDAAGIISTIAGAMPPGFGGDDGPAVKALLSIPHAVAVAPDGTIHVSDSGNSRIRSIDPAGTIRTVVGSGGQAGLFSAGFKGDDGPAVQAQIFSAADVAFDASGRMYVSDSGNNRIRRVENGTIHTVAGTGKAGFSGDGGPATAAELNTPQKLWATPDGEVYFADQSNHRIRRIDGRGIITTVAGSGPPSGYVYER